MGSELFIAGLGVVLSIVSSVASVARIWGKSESRFDGIDQSLERIETGNSAVCVEHREKMKALDADVNRHQEWLSDQSTLIHVHGDRITRLEAARGG